MADVNVYEEVKEIISAIRTADEQKRFMDEKL
jgi:hypothetical protein